MKKFLQILFNVVWVLTGGLLSAISNGLFGCLLCLTIIGIPFGLQYFKFIKLSFAPAGKTVATSFFKHPIMNILWLIFGGFEAVLLYCALGILLCVSIIGFPIGKQMFKIASFLFAPFGAEIVKCDEYTSSKDTGYDYDLLADHIMANPHFVIGKDTDGNEMTALVCVRKQWDNSPKKIWNAPSIIAIICSFLALISTVLYIIGGINFMCTDFYAKLAEEYKYIYYIAYLLYFVGVAIVFAPFILASKIFNQDAYRLRCKNLAFLMEYYPNGSPLKPREKAKFDNLFGAIPNNGIVSLSMLIQKIKKEENSLQQQSPPYDPNIQK